MDGTALDAHHNLTAPRRHPRAPRRGVTAWSDERDRVSGEIPDRRTAGPGIRLVELTPAAIHALAAGDLAAANRAAAVLLTPYFVSADWRSSWLRRSRQVAADPGVTRWIAHAVVDPALQLAVGRAGFHGPPDATGTVEIAYAVDPAYRRRGYARAALEALLERAAREPSVRVVRATIRPDNVASRALVDQYGFRAVGEQWDDEDGLETILERPA
jgi:[ribosomal protein S5]-alanine N-acetyltransferase